MRLTTFSEYALVALMYICRNQGTGNIPLSKIVKEHGLPVKYMEHIMHKLSRSGVLISAKGKNGGYRFAVPADRITIAQIVRLFDGPLAPTESASTYFYRSTPIEKEKKIHRLMKEVRDYISARLESLTLKDML